MSSAVEPAQIAVIPSGWDAVQFSDLFDFKNGVNADKHAYGHGVPFANVLEVITNSHLHAGLIPGRVALDTGSIKVYQVRPGDVLFNRTSETQGEVGLSSVYLDDAPVVFGGFVIRGRPKRPIDRVYVGYALRASAVRSQIVARGQGAIRANIGQADLRTVVAVLPSPAEQAAIAAALSDTDTLIAALDRLIAKKRDVKQAAVQQLLTGKRRLSGFSEKWTDRLFGSLAAPRRERVDLSRHAVGPVIELEDVQQVTGRLIGGRTPGVGASLKSVFEPGDVLFGKLRAYLRKYWLADRFGACSTEFWVLRADKRFVTPEFLFQLVQTDKFIEAASTAYGTHMPRSDWAVVRRYEVPTPPVCEQAAIANLLTDMDAEIGALEARREKTRLLKQGMMQELLTGRIRLV